MAYNTGRTGEAPNHVGQRRNQPPISANFIAGGQLMSQNRLYQLPPAAPAHANNTSFGQIPQQQQPQPHIQTRPVQPAAVPAFPKPPIASAPTFGNTCTKPEGEIPVSEKKKPFWITGDVKKITRKERHRRRAIRLSRIIQPKNAVVSLNELVRDVVYTTTNADHHQSPNQFHTSVKVNGVTHEGYGRTKMEAKSNAAEMALKHIVKNKKLALSSTPTTAIKVEAAVEGDVAMDCTDHSDAPLPWQHVASFALYKLLNSWGEDSFLKVNNNPLTSTTAESSAALQSKPPKQMPNNAADMNPVMLLNQMMPQVEYTEVGQFVTPPNTSYTYHCTVDGKTFTGTGRNKKSAKKMVAYAVCSGVLGVQYPPETYAPDAV